jgi:hypothetical protein
MIGEYCIRLSFRLYHPSFARQIVFQLLLCSCFLFVILLVKHELLPLYGKCDEILIDLNASLLKTKMDYA